jgi:uncharacterized membrane protein YbhN (UPF0104 family)
MDAQDKELEIYKQRCEGFRSLNEIMWRIPVMVMTITGGLWFAIAKFEMTSYSRSALLLFGIILNAVFIIVLFRIRVVMNKLLKLTNEFEGIPHKKGFFVVWCFSFGMLAMIIACAVAMVSLDKVFEKTERSVQPTAIMYNNCCVFSGQDCLVCKK